MRRGVVVLVAAAAMVYACSSFSESSGGGPGPVADGGLALADGAIPGDAAGNDAAADASATCDGGCIFFEDAFERDAGDVLGMWSARDGEPTLFPAEPRGNVLAASMPEADGGAERVSVLRKTIAPRTSVRVNADLKVEVAGTFGSGAANDYCDFIDVFIDTTLVATIFMDANGLGAWQLDGQDVYFAPGPVLAENWQAVELAVSWASGLAVSAQVGGSTLTLGPTPTSMPPGTATVRVGLRCNGVTPQIAAYVDNVVLRSIP